jgi:hypothetical protein
MNGRHWQILEVVSYEAPYLITTSIGPISARGFTFFFNFFYHFVEDQKLHNIYKIQLGPV